MSERPALGESLEAALDALRLERQAVSARLDAIDLAIDNIARVGKGAARGGSGPREAAADRRDELLAIIRAAKNGVGTRDLRARTPHMAGESRSAALQQLKIQGAIRRVGKVWKV